MLVGYLGLECIMLLGLHLIPETCLMTVVILSDLSTKKKKESSSSCDKKDTPNLRSPVVENSLRDSGHEAERDLTLSLALMDNADRPNGPIASTELKRSEEKKALTEVPPSSFS